MFDLKPCPFCGSENAKLDNDYLPKYFVPKCKDCGLSHGLFDSYKQAIEAWNYRPIEDALRAENERLRAMISSVYVVAPTPKNYRQVTVERALQLDGSSLWAIRQPNGFCMNHKGEWDFEPLPSSRTEKFLKSFRFETMDEAIEKALSATKQEGE